MSHFQNEITQKQFGWQVETGDAGTCFVPGDVQAVPDWLALGKAISAGDEGIDGIVFDALKALISDYVEGRRIESIEVCSGYFARLSAPGYLDCTEWCCYSTIKEAREALRDI